MMDCGEPYSWAEPWTGTAFLPENLQLPQPFKLRIIALEPFLAVPLSHPGLEKGHAGVPVPESFHVRKDRCAGPARMPNGGNGRPG